MITTTAINQTRLALPVIDGNLRRHLHRNEKGALGPNLLLTTVQPRLQRERSKMRRGATLREVQVEARQQTLQLCAYLPFLLGGGASGDQKIVVSCAVSVFMSKELFTITVRLCSFFTFVAAHLIGKVKYVKSSTNCLIRISGHDTNERMRITIESLRGDPKSQLNSLRHANYIIEKALVECLADENSKTRLLYDLAFSNSFQLTHRDSTSGLLLLQKEIKGGSHASKSKEWWHLYELPCRWEMHPHDLSSIRLKLPKGSDCKIEVFGRSVKVSRESPYVLVSGTKLLDVKNAALMVSDAVRRHRSIHPCRPKR